jgi:hypothetical protein
MPAIIANTSSSASISSRVRCRFVMVAPFVDRRAIYTVSSAANPVPFSSVSNLMSNHVYKLVELTGSSPVSSDDAIRNAITRAAQTIRNMRWFEKSSRRAA